VELPQLILIMVKGRLVVGSFLGLQAAPFDGEAVRVGTDTFHKGDIAGYPVPGVGGGATVIAILNRPWLILEVPPVIIGIPALYLVRGRRRTEQEAPGKDRRELATRDARWETGLWVEQAQHATTSKVNSQSTDDHDCDQFAPPADGCSGP
jgi:hypothetical protein